MDDLMLAGAFLCAAGMIKTLMCFSPSPLDCQVEELSVLETFLKVRFESGRLKSNVVIAFLLFSPISWQLNRYVVSKK